MADTSRPVLIGGQLMHISQPPLSSRPSTASNADTDSSGQSSSRASSRLASPDHEESAFHTSEAGFRLPGPSLRPDRVRDFSSLAASVKKQAGIFSCASTTYCLAAKVAAVLVAVSLYNAYLVYAIHYHVAGGKELDWCGGLGFLIVLTLLVYVGLFYFHVVKRCVRHYRLRLVLPGRLQRLLATRLASILATLAVMLAIIVFLVLDSSRDRYRCAIV